MGILFAPRRRLFLACQTQTREISETNERLQGKRHIMARRSNALSSILTTIFRSELCGFPPRSSLGCCGANNGPGTIVKEISSPIKILGVPEKIFFQAYTTVLQSFLSMPLVRPLCLSVWPPSHHSFLWSGLLNIHWSLSTAE